MFVLEMCATTVCIINQRNETKLSFIFKLTSRTVGLTYSRPDHTSGDPLSFEISATYWRATKSEAKNVPESLCLFDLM